MANGDSPDGLAPFRYQKFPLLRRGVLRLGDAKCP